jgi:hypothetical protein
MMSSMMRRNAVFSVARTYRNRILFIVTGYAINAGSITAYRQGNVWISSLIREVSER